MDEEFDFGFSTDGELILNTKNQDILKTDKDDLRIQIACNRIKSIDHNWFYDEIGANMEELIGYSIKEDVVEIGRQKIFNVLTYDNLWSLEDIHIQSKILNKQNIIYTIYFRIFDETTEEERAIELVLTLDLVKGVKIKYGW